MALHHRSSHGTIFIRHVPMGPTVTHPWCLQFIIKVSAWSYLHAMCTYGTLLHPTCICRTYSYSFVTLAIHHKSICSVLCPSDKYLWDPLASNLWDPMAYVSCVPLGPFSISIWPMGPDDPSPSDLWDPTAYVTLDACNSSLLGSMLDLCYCVINW